MKGFHAIGRVLRECGVDPLFGLMGDSNMMHTAAFINEGGKYIAAVDEGGAVGMADGYSRITGRVGVVTVTHGPGATNTLTALIDAVRSDSRLLLICGDTPAERNYSQRINLEHLASLAGADYWRVQTTGHIAEDVALMLRRVADTRRPLLLDIPIDLQKADVTYESVPSQPLAQQVLPPGQHALDQALGVVASARRPVILAGRGAVLSGAKDALIELADLLDAPLATTVLAKDLFRGHPFDLGFMGTLSTPTAIDVISKSDCILAFGAGLNVRTTEKRGLMQNAAIVRCDMVPASLHRNVPADAAVLGDARMVATEMTELLKAADFRGSGYRTSALGPDGVPRRSPREEFTDCSTETSVDMRTAMVWFDEHLPEDRIVVSDGGRFMHASWKYLHVRNAEDFVQTSFNWGAVGLGVSATIGVASASGDRLTVGVVGDGGGMMGLIEFTTAVRHNIPFVLIVLNDGAYGAEYTKLKLGGMNPDYSLLAWPELAEMAVAMGGNGITVRNLSELEATKDALSTVDKPLLIDVKCDPSAGSWR